jgi:hypothetical protein
MAESTNKRNLLIKGIVWRAVKATVKAVLFYAIYLFVWSFLTPVSEYVPAIQQVAETFVAIYIVLMIIGEMTSGTIYAQAFNVARALFVIAYLLMSVQSGVFSMSFEGVSLMVDLSFLMVFAMLLGLLGVARSIMQAINYLHQKAELASI